MSESRLMERRVNWYFLDCSKEHHPIELLPDGVIGEMDGFYVLYTPTKVIEGSNMPVNLKSIDGCKIALGEKTGSGLSLYHHVIKVRKKAKKYERKCSC